LLTGATFLEKDIDMAGANGLIPDAEIPDPDEDREEAPKDIRSTIRAAVEEHKDDEDTEADGKEPRHEREPKQRAARSAKKNEDSADPDNDKEVQEAVDDTSAGRKVSKEESDDKKGDDKEASAIEAPPFFKNKGKATWEKLSPEDKKTIIAREKEVSDGFAQVSQRIRNVEDLERAIAPRLQSIQQFGVSPGVVVDRLFQWMEGLNDPTRRVNTFKQLAASFGMNVNQLASGVEPEKNEPDPNAPPSWFNEFTGTVEKKIGTLEQQLTAQKDAAVESFILNWAKDKPHYGKVSQLMGQLMQSGAVPALDASGSVNLDGAYEAAIKLNPEVAALIQQEQNDKTAAEATQKALKEAKEKADRLARAKRAGVGLKPAAPSLPAGALNGKGQKEDTSIRAAIRKSIEDLRS
jgi:hypothetical protein